MRLTSQVTDTRFPFKDERVPFVLVVPGPEGLEKTKDDRGFEHASTHDKKFELIKLAQDLQADGVPCSLLATWPGKTRSDVFLVDDYGQALAAMGATPSSSSEDKS